MVIKAQLQPHLSLEARVNLTLNLLTVSMVRGRAPPQSCDHPGDTVEVKTVISTSEGGVHDCQTIRNSANIRVEKFAQCSERGGEARGGWREGGGGGTWSF